ncbi:MAG: hypothetical protein C4555_00955 [Dehalococcoidia bacterium]|nr:MAG: hypothetical protein C4555_00955 [Dehalococcoidia bacterium]
MGEGVASGEMRGEGSGATGVAAAAWSLGGVCLLFSGAVFRLGRRGVETVRAGLDPEEWAALLLLVLVFVVGEGWGALQRKWVPRLVRRASWLRHGGSPVHRALAPLYGMSLIGAPPAALLRAWGGTAAIVAAVLVVRKFPEPWRGIVDLAVAAALLWGLGAIAVAGRRSLGSRGRRT